MSVHLRNLFIGCLSCAAMLTTVGCDKPVETTPKKEAPEETTKPKAEVPEPAVQTPAVQTPAVQTPADKTPADKTPEKETTATDKPAAGNKTTVDVNGMTFTAPEGWQSADHGFVEARFALPGDDGAAKLTIMAAGGSKQANIDRWIGQFQVEPGEEPKVTEIGVDGESAALVDIRGTFSGQPNTRMLGFIIPFTAANNYFVKVTGPKSTVGKHEEAILQFVKSGKKK